MSYIGNSPAAKTVIRAEARKSLALGLWFKDSTGKSLDISNSTIRIVAKAEPLDGADSADADNLITNSQAILSSPTIGYARLELQAEDLDHPVGEYPFAIVLWDSGYSAVVVRGVLELMPNTDFSSVSEYYSGVNPAIALEVVMREAATIEVRTGPTLAPGTVSFTVADEEKLDGIEPGAQVNVPADWNFLANRPSLGSAAFANVEEIAVPLDGSPGEILMKTASGFEWAAPPATGEAGTLDATGVPAGEVPTANGAGSWTWDVIPAAVVSVNGLDGVVVLDLDDVADTATRLAMTPAERSKLAGLNNPPAWADISGKPAFGDAALADADDFLPSTGIDASKVISGTLAAARVPKVSALQGFSSGTAAPSGGADGDFYFQYS